MKPLPPEEEEPRGANGLSEPGPGMVGGCSGNGNGMGAPGGSSDGSCATGTGDAGGCAGGFWQNGLARKCKVDTDFCTLGEMDGCCDGFECREKKVERSQVILGALMSMVGFCVSST